MTKIVVTEEDITEGLRGNGSNCPITMAARRVLGCDVFTSRRDLYIYGILGRRVGLPIEARQFIMAFDTDEEVKPFAFSIKD